MINWGSVPANSVLPFPFDTFAGSTGASITISGLATSDIKVYKGGSVTERSSTSGYTLIDTDGIDVDTLTGIHGFTIDTSDNTDSGFYSVGSFFWVVVSAITVDSQTVSFVAGTFRLTAAESVAGKPKVDTDTFGGTAGTFASGRPEVNTTHAAGTAWGSGAITAAALATDAVTEITDGTKTALGIVSGTADSGTTTTMVDAALTEADADYWVGSVIVFTSGNIANQARVITDFVPGTDTITFSPATTQAVGTNTYIIIPLGSVNVATWRAELPNSLNAGRVDARITAISAGAITSGAFSADAIDANALAATAVTEIQSGLATQASVDVIDDFLDTEVAAILAAVDTEVAAIKAKTDSLTFTTANRVDSQVFGMEAGTVTAAAVATNAIDADAIAADAVDEIWDEVMEGTTTARQSLRLANSANGAKLSGAATTSIAVRDLADTKNRIAATVDADGNRSAVTLDLT